MTKKTIEGIMGCLAHDICSFVYSGENEKNKVNKVIAKSTQQIKELIIKEFEGWDFGYKDGYDEFKEVINKL